MQIVVDIPENILDTIQADEMISRDQLAVLQMHILNGKTLPKGHGRLIDASNITFSQFFNAGDYAQARRGIYEAPTIIEADKEESEV